MTPTKLFWLSRLVDAAGVLDERTLIIRLPHDELARLADVAFTVRRPVAGASWPEGTGPFRIRADPARVGAVVSETIRFEPSITAAPRTVAEPIEICGIERPAGTLLMCTFLTANRDREVWRDPDSFQSRRFDAPDAPRLLSFGGGHTTALAPP